MASNQRGQVVIYDPATGLPTIIQRQGQQQPQQPLMEYQHQPQMMQPQYPPLQPYYPPPMPVNPAQMQMQQQGWVSDREYQRRERKAGFAGTFFALFIISWIPCAFGMGGITLLAWGLLGAVTLYRACR